MQPNDETIAPLLDLEDLPTFLATTRHPSGTSTPARYAYTLITDLLTICAPRGHAAMLMYYISSAHAIDPSRQRKPLSRYIFDRTHNMSMQRSAIFVLVEAGQETGGDEEFKEEFVRAVGGVARVFLGVVEREEELEREMGAEVEGGWMEEWREKRRVWAVETFGEEL